MIAPIRTSQSSHWYYKDGSPCYEIQKKSGKGTRSPTIADARELGLLPSVTTVLKIVNKPLLQDWLITQAVKAVIETPRLPGENDEQFINRVLVEDRIQDSEAAEAASRGSQIHNAIESAIQAVPFDDQWIPYVQAVFPVIESLGKVIWSEKVVVGDGYAGRGDLLVGNEFHLVLLDFKTSKKVPKESYDDHRMQTAAYAKTIGNTADTHVLTGNLYISTSSPGEVNLCLQENWIEAYEDGFAHALKLWQYMKGYRP